MYSFNGKDWSLEQKITDNTYSTFASGGIALWNNYLIVGNKDEDNGATVDAGSVSIFKKSSNAAGGTTFGTWQKVAGGFPLSGANYKMGAYVAMYGDVAAVAGGGAGFLVLYRKGTTDSWTAEQTITLTLGAQKITSVALYGHFLAIGSYYGISHYVDIYRYDPVNSTWSSYQQIIGSNSSGFGSSVSLTDGLLAVAASSTKEVKIYRNKGSSTKFAIEVTLTRPTGEDGDFGADVAINQGAVLVGVPGGTSSTTANNKGHAYLYTYVKGTGWKTVTDPDVSVVKEISFNPSYSGKNYFGASVGLSESMAIIGVGNQSTTEFNKAYIYPVGP